MFFTDDPKDKNVLRDITREDEGFNWRKAMYYLPNYDVYYLFDQENLGVMVKFRCGTVKT